MVRTFLKVYMELGSYFLFLQEQIKDIIITAQHWTGSQHRGPRGPNVSGTLGVEMHAPASGGKKLEETGCHDLGS
jgi:hypothetical protein